METWPDARLPLHPVLSWRAFLGGAGAAPTVLDAGAVRHVVSGRMALAVALEAIGAGAGDTVLLPAYHCPAMVEPVVWRGAAPRFFRVRPDLALDLADLAAKLDGVKAVLASHYFGFPQDLAPLRALCDDRGIALIEDCAHVWFGPVGAAGDYAIASSWKFFPVREGGALVSARRALAPVAQAPFGFQVRAAVNAVEDAHRFGRLPVLAHLLLPLLWLKDRWLRRRPPAPQDAAPSVALGSSAFDPRWVGVRMSLWSRLMRRCAGARAPARRRANYARLLAATRGLAGARPLFADLPDGVVPYVFPVLLDAPERAFPALKRAGVPVLRFGDELWEDGRGLDCPVTRDYSRRLVQLPCHQELRPDEIDWIAARLREAVAA